MGYRRASHRDGAAEDGAQGLELLGVQGSTSADEVHCISSREAGEQSSTKLLHGRHVIGCQLANGFQVAMALSGVLREGYWDWTARLLPRWQGGRWGRVCMGACAAATTA